MAHREILHAHAGRHLVLQNPVTHRCHDAQEQYFQRLHDLPLLTRCWCFWLFDATWCKKKRITKTRKHESTKARKEKQVGHEFEELSNRLIGAAIDVHKELGPGFLESVYQRAMEVALMHRGIAFERQKEIHVF